MDETTKKAKIDRFLADKAMTSSVYDVLLSSFLKRKTNEDTEMKAARFVATELLEEAWKELEKYKNEKEKVDKLTGNVGL